MIIATTETVAGKTVVETFGLVSGSIVLSKNMFSDLGAGFKSMVGGELTAYTKMQDDARQKAVGRMIEAAERLGANAIVQTRYSSSAVMQGASEIIVFGTAVRVE